MNSVTIARHEAEDFLFAEARLLEAGDLDAWLALFEEGGRYLIPTTLCVCTLSRHRGWARQ